MILKSSKIAALLFCCLCTGYAGAQDDINSEVIIDTTEELEIAETTPGEQSSDDLARELSNPNTPLAKLTLKNTTTFFKGSLPGANDQEGNVTLFQPVFPFPLSEEGTTNLFIRPALVYLSGQPVPGPGSFESESGLADMGFDIALGRSYDSGLIVVGGVQGLAPIGSDKFSADQWRLGPELVMAYITKKGFIGAFPAHQWDVSGGEDFSTTTLELFLGLQLQGGKTLASQPQLSYDHLNDEWTIPLNATLRKVMRFGSMPVQVSASLDYFVEQPDQFGPDWAISISFTPIVPNFIYSWIKN